MDTAFPVFLPSSARQDFGNECPKSIPWRILEPKEVTVLALFKMNLKTLAERGGLDPREIKSVFKGEKLTVGSGEPMHECVKFVQDLIEDDLQDTSPGKENVVEEAVPAPELVPEAVSKPVPPPPPMTEEHPPAVIEKATSAITKKPSSPHAPTEASSTPPSRKKPVALTPESRGLGKPALDEVTLNTALPKVPVPREMLQRILDRFEQHRVMYREWSFTNTRGDRNSEKTAYTRLLAAEDLAKLAIRDMIMYCRYGLEMVPGEMPGLLDPDPSLPKDKFE